MVAAVLVFISSVMPQYFGCKTAQIYNENPQAALWNATEVPLEGCVPGGGFSDYLPNWTTEGDGYFSDPNSDSTIYYPGPNDILNAEVTVTLTAIYTGRSNPPYVDADLLIEFILRN